MILRFHQLLALDSAALGAAQSATEAGAVVTTGLGAFGRELFPDKGPKHIEQSIRLARQGYYAGSAFLRGVLNAVVRGGDPLLKGAKTPRGRWGTL